MKQSMMALTIALVVLGIVAVVYLTLNANRQDQAINIIPSEAPQVESPVIREQPVSIDIPKPVYRETPVSVDIPKLTPSENEDSAADNTTTTDQ